MPRFIHDGKLDHEHLHEIVKVVTRNLNRIIDRNYYPVEAARRSNLRHRPIGIGVQVSHVSEVMIVQGLADVFAILGLPFSSSEASKLNLLIFETMSDADGLLDPADTTAHWRRRMRLRWREESRRSNTIKI